MNAPQVGRQPLPRVMNFSFGIQREVGFGTVVDASYVGSLGRNLLYVRDMNPIPMYARFDPANVDWTTGSPLPDNFLRPYYGLSSINVRGFGATSNYHSLQVTANRRMKNGLQYGVAYTFSKLLGVGAADFDGVSPCFSMRKRNYGLISYDATHALVINYVYELPNLAARWHKGYLNQVFGYWRLSGITTFQSGFPFTPTFSTSDTADLTGSSEGARITVVCDPKLPKDQRTFERTFRTEFFKRTPKGDFGNAGIGLLRGPGIENFDISVTKRFPITEQRYFWLRGESFNAFNHTQFSGVSSAARFDPAGNQFNLNFGAYTSARNPRRIQLSLRFMF